MERKRIAIVGLGQRGSIYADYAEAFSDEYELAAVTDVEEQKLKDAGGKYGVPVFDDYRKFIAAKIPCDIVAVATQDEQHAEHAVELIKAGYSLLLEKPIANTLPQCLEIYDAAKKYNKKVVVCHVLRYTPFYRKIKEIIDGGGMGRIVNVSATENVGYYHQAHSFVRGPWRNKEQSSPMILAKCCHDMDILRWLIGVPCQSVSSIGCLSVFKNENAPKDSAPYCSDCKADCIYRASEAYIAHPWMANYFLTGENNAENILKQLPHTQYDRCVYRADNNVVDHQDTVLQFAEEITAHHTMTAFSKEIYRDIKIHGTKAELVGVMEEEKSFLELRTFGGETQRLSFDTSSVTIGGHGGGDAGMMHELYLELNNEKTLGISYIDVSIDSHKMAFAAEESRLKNGERVILR